MTADPIRTWTIEPTVVSGGPHPMGLVEGRVVEGPWRDQAREGLAAADAADPLRDRGRSVPIIEQALAAWWAVPGPLEPGRDLAEAVFDALNGGGET